MAVDVVVTNYKTPGLLRDFIASYEEHRFDGCHLTIIDVCPDVPALYPHEHTYASTQVNLGYSGACNLGAQFGSNDVILLANSDTRLTAGFEECYRELIAQPNWGVLGPRQVDEFGQITAGGIFGEDHAPRQRGWQEQDSGQYGDVRPDALTVSGALYFIKRHVWEELTRCPQYQAVNPGTTGAFLDTPHYYEETFCSYHARAHGWHCTYYGPVQMVHLWHRSSAPGGGPDQQMAASKELHRAACRAHGITCE